MVFSRNKYQRGTAAVHGPTPGANIVILILAQIALSDQLPPVILRYNMKSIKRTMGLLVAPPFELLDLAGPIAVFSNLNLVEGNRCLYDIKIISTEKAGNVTSADGSWMGPAIHYARFKGSLDTLLIIGGMGSLKPLTPSFKTWLRERAKRVRRIGSICIGAFVLAEAGILKNQRAVTHWRYCSELSRRFPNLKVEVNPIFIKRGQCLHECWRQCRH